MLGLVLIQTNRNKTAQSSICIAEAILGLSNFCHTLYINANIIQQVDKYYKKKRITKSWVLAEFINQIKAILFSPQGKEVNQYAVSDTGREN